MAGDVANREGGRVRERVETGSEDSEASAAGGFDENFPTIRESLDRNQARVRGGHRVDDAPSKRGGRGGEESDLPAHNPKLPLVISAKNSQGAKVKPLYSSMVNKDRALKQYTVDCSVVSGVVTADIPKDVLDAAPLWKEFIVGRFPEDAPFVGVIQVIVNNIWTLRHKEMKIEVYTINKRMVKFRIPNDSARQFILERGMWNIAGKPMSVSKWSPYIEETQPALTALPLWVHLKNVPRALFSREGISWIASMAGAPKYLHPDTAQCKSFEEAKVFVEVKLTKELPKEFHVKQDGIDEVVVFHYPFLPSRCTSCSKWGHLEDSCLAKTNSDSNAALGENENVQQAKQVATEDANKEVHEKEKELRTEVLRETGHEASGSGDEAEVQKENEEVNRVINVTEGVGTREVETFRAATDGNSDKDHDGGYEEGEVREKHAGSTTSTASSTQEIDSEIEGSKAEELKDSGNVGENSDSVVADSFASIEKEDNEGHWETVSPAKSAKTRTREEEDPVGSPSVYAALQDKETVDEEEFVDLVDTSRRLRNRSVQIQQTSQKQTPPKKGKGKKGNAKKRS